MLKIFQKRDVLVRIFLALVVGLIGLMMVITLVPGPVGELEEAPDVVADVAGEKISLTEVRRQLARLERGGRAIPPALRALYAEQIVGQLIYEQLLELEAERLGVRVTDGERVQRIQQRLPMAFAGGTFIGLDRYAAEVQQRFEMGVPEFEEIIRRSLLEEKFRRLVSDGITASPEEVQREFRRRNEKVKIDYVVLKPEQLESRVALPEAELAQYFEKNKARYQVSEKRGVRYALLDTNLLRQRVSVSDAELRAYYNDHLDRYRIQNRAHVIHILFKTVGKTDAEVEEIRRKAEDVLKKVRRGGRGASFEDLAKQHSEDTTKDKGGDLGWIVPGQTVPEFEQTAFSLPKGTISDLVKTQYGFHIIKVVDRETARTQGLEEVRASIVPVLADEKAEALASELVDKMAAAVRRSNRQPLENIAKEFGLSIAESRPVGVGESVGELGSAQELQDVIFRMREAELSSPMRTDRGYVILTVTRVQPAHQGTLAEVLDRVAADYRREKATELARTLAQELAQEAQASGNLSQPAKALGFDVKTSEPFALAGSVPDVGSARQLAAAFSMPVGKVSPAMLLAGNWLIFRVTAREEAKPEEFEKQRKDIEQQVLQGKRSLAYETFRNALEERMRKEGKLRINAENLKRLSSIS